MQFQTVQSESSTVPGGHWQSVDLYPQAGWTIVSLGIQTNNNQTSFVPTQFCVMDNGQHAYVQVSNNQLGRIGWWVWMVCFSESAGGEAPEVTAKFSEPVALSKE